MKALRRKWWHLGDSLAEIKYRYPEDLHALKEFAICAAVAALFLAAIVAYGVAPR